MSFYMGGKVIGGNAIEGKGWKILYKCEKIFIWEGKFLYGRENFGGGNFFRYPYR